jgi:hypothetical protein
MSCKKAGHNFTQAQHGQNDRKIVLYCTKCGEIKQVDPEKLATTAS